MMQGRSGGPGTPRDVQDVSLTLPEYQRDGYVPVSFSHGGVNRPGYPPSDTYFNFFLQQLEFFIIQIFQFLVSPRYFV